MILTNEQIYGITEALYELRAAAMPVKLSFLIAKNAIILEPYYKAINEARDKVLRQFGYDGSPDFRFSDEQVDQVNAELLKLQAMENEVSAAAIPLSALLEKETNVTPAFIQTLYPLISEEA